MSHLQIIVASPAVSASKGQMQAVGAKSGAVQSHEIDRTSIGLPSLSPCVRRCCFPSCSAERSFPTSLVRFDQKARIEPLDGNSRDKSHLLREDSKSLPLQQMSSDEGLIADYSGTDLTIGKHPMEYRGAELRREKVRDQVRPPANNGCFGKPSERTLKRHPTTQTDHAVKQKAKGRIPFQDLVPRYPCYRRTGFGYQLAASPRRAR